MTREEEIIARAGEAEKETTFSDIVFKAKGVNSAYGIGYIEGAQWADEHPKAEEPKNKDFKDFVKSYMSANDDNILHYYDRYAGLVDGAQWQKEQMMKGAVEAYVNFYEEIPGNYYTEFVVENLRPRFGDKVKLIIIKEE